MRGRSGRLRPVVLALLAAALVAASCVTDLRQAAAQIAVPPPPPPISEPGHRNSIGRDVGIGVGIGVVIGIIGLLIEHTKAPPPPPPQIADVPPATLVSDTPASGTTTEPVRHTVRHVARGAGNGGSGGNNGTPPRGEHHFVPDEVIVTSTASPQVMGQIARRFNLTQLDTQSLPLIGTSVFRLHILGGRSVASVIGVLQNEGVVSSAQPNYLFAMQEQPAQSPAKDQDDVAEQYVLEKLQIPEAHKIATGRGIAVAVVDSSIDDAHPDLDGSILKRFDAIGGEVNPHQHGTGMAGAIAAHGKLTGTASASQLLAARAFGDTGEAQATSFAVLKSLQWAADNGARVVNMSFAGPADPTLHRMLTALYEKGIVLIAAAGNAGPKSPPLYPGADPDVIAVTATDSDDRIFKMANRGRYVAVAAPGVEVLALAPDGAYQITTGTSVAAAEVSGVAAMLLEHKPSLKPADVRNILTATAKPLGSKGRNDEFGAGLVNAYQALTQEAKTSRAFGGELHAGR